MINDYFVSLCLISDLCWCTAVSDFQMCFVCFQLFAYFYWRLLTLYVVCSFCIALICFLLSSLLTGGCNKKSLTFHLALKFIGNLPVSVSIKYLCSLNFLALVIAQQCHFSYVGNFEAQFSLFCKTATFRG